MAHQQRRRWFRTMSTYTQLKSIPYYRIMLTNVNDLQGLNYGKVNLRSVFSTVQSLKLLLRKGFSSLLILITKS
jgi:hypothetical protein